MSIWIQALNSYKQEKTWTIYTDMNSWSMNGTYVYSDRYIDGWIPIHMLHHIIIKYSHIFIMFPYHWSREYVYPWSIVNDFYARDWPKNKVTLFENDNTSAIYLGARIFVMCIAYHYICEIFSSCREWKKFRFLKHFLRWCAPRHSCEYFSLTVSVSLTILPMLYFPHYLDVH